MLGAVPRPDAGEEPDASSGSTVDAGVVDAGRGGPDGGTETGVDAGRAPVDAGMVFDDAGPVRDAGSRPPVDAGTGGISAFIAQGAMGRTTISCDDGKTWVGDRSWDTQADPLMCGAAQSCTCFTGTCDYRSGNSCEALSPCIDTPDVAKGIAFGNGQWVATFGWGRPGAVRTSVNGIDWVTTHGDDSFGGLVFGGGRFVAASRTPITSSDGRTWVAGHEADFRSGNGTQIWSVRRLGFADVLGGRFVAVASGDTDRDVLISADLGVTWRRPKVLPGDCAQLGSEYGGIVAGNGVIVMVDEQGRACRSVDGGDTWSLSQTGASEVLSHGVWTGSEFQFWGNRHDLLRSTDGVTWSKTPMTTPTNLGPVAYDPATGVYVAAGSVWSGYSDQAFFRSTDGLRWSQLPSTAFHASHPIFYIAVGTVVASAVCPAR